MHVFLVNILEFDRFQWLRSSKLASHISIVLNQIYFVFQFHAKQCLRTFLLANLSHKTLVIHTLQYTEIIFNINCEHDQQQINNEIIKASIYNSLQHYMQ